MNLKVEREESISEKLKNSRGIFIKQMQVVCTFLRVSDTL
jgi:hypothetical protein